MSKDSRDLPYQVLHVSSSDIGSGAAKAAYRIHQCMCEHGYLHGISSHMRVKFRVSDDYNSVTSGPPSSQSPLARLFHSKLERYALRGFSTTNTSYHCTSWPSTGLGREINQNYKSGNLDVVHLHGIGSALSVEEIGKLTTPLVWTLHDQWAFCGAETYVSFPPTAQCDSSDERYINGYRQDNRPKYESGRDVNRWTWLRKKASWKTPISIIAPSRWLAECAKKSYLMRDWPVAIIPYSINLSKWAPYNKTEARSLLGLPQDSPLILFGATGGTRDLRKGADLLFSALEILRTKTRQCSSSQASLVVFGESEPNRRPSVNFPIYYCGRLYDDLSLRLVYAAADVFVIPSRQDNLPNTGLEAHACGRPVVGFNTGGLSDIIDDRVTGALAEPFDPHSLASCIYWVIKDKSRLASLSSSARSRAESLWNPQRISRMYAEIYLSLLCS